MLEKIIMIVSAGLMLVNEMLGLGYEKVEITAAVALIAAIVASAIGRLRHDAAAQRVREKELDLKLRTAEVKILELRDERAGRLR
ncbi:MAG: hypothetical protein JW889_14990 [Verrucomicrobia bacterium]|nr:hypothetical protein [Verrucomicrobiota bacterium]